MYSADPTILQRFLDGELDPSQAALVARHVDSCDSCRTELEALAGDRSFVQHHLGLEDDGEEDAAAASLATVAASVKEQTTAPPWWRRSWLSSAAVITIAVIVMFSFGANLSARPIRILEEAASRQRFSLYQPNKILAWEVEAVSRGIKEMPDGRSRTMFWQKNGPTTFRQISRQYDTTGRIERANWMQPDGSTIVYRTRGTPVIEISPATADARAALVTLAAEDRNALESYLGRRESLRSLEFFRDRDAEWLHRPDRNGGTASVKMEVSENGDEIFSINVENGPSKTNPMILGAQHHYEIERSTFRLRRLRSTLSYADGTTGVRDARWLRFREISQDEFDAQSPRQLLGSGVPITRFTPLQVARRYQNETLK